MILDTLITDRTAADVARVKALSQKGFDNMTAAEKVEYLQSMKGAYNASDLNRVGAAVAYVANRLNSIGGFDLHPTAKQDWLIEDIPTSEDMDAYHDDIANIRAAYAVIAPQTPSIDNLTFGGANDIEKILIAVDAALVRATYAFRHSGTFYSNMGGLFL